MSQNYRADWIEIEGESELEYCYDDRDLGESR